MSEPTKERLQEFLKGWYQRCKEDNGCPALGGKACFEIDTKRCDEAFQTICVLIEKFFEWQEQAEYIWELSPTLEGFVDDVPLKKLIREIRDFGKEGK